MKPISTPFVPKAKPIPPPLDGKWWTVDAKTDITISTLKGPVRLKPSAVMNDATVTPPPHSGFIKWIDVPALVRDPSTKHLGILRPGELGDVIVALTAARMIRKLLPNLETVRLHCKEEFHTLLNGQGEVLIRGVNPNPKPGEVLINFTMYFELDHNPGTAKIPRLDRVLRTFGFEPPYGD